MYICPTCGRAHDTEEEIRKHFLACWREKNPGHKSKPAPRGVDTEMRQISSDIADFFNSFGA